MNGEYDPYVCDNTVKEAAVVKPVQAGLTKIKNGLDCLDDVIGQLFKECGSALSAEIPSPKCDDTPSESMGNSPICTQVNTLSDRLMSLVSHLCEFRNRLEV